MIATVTMAPIATLVLVAFAVQTAGLVFCALSFLISGATPRERESMTSNGVWICLTGWAILAGHVAANI